MAKLSLTEVSKRFKVSRSTIYRAIKEGRLSRSADNQFDLAEVIRCFGEPPSNLTNQDNLISTSKDDADLRQLVDFMKKEIDSYKDREKRYLDQIDRFQLLLGHKESPENTSHETSVTRTNDTTCDTPYEIPRNLDIKGMEQNETSHDSFINHLNEAPQDSSMTHNKTQQKQSKKRGLFGRVFNALFNE